jgi:hypothetical protein
MITTAGMTAEEAWAWDRLAPELKGKINHLAHYREWIAAGTTPEFLEPSIDDLIDETEGRIFEIDDEIESLERERDELERELEELNRKKAASEVKG